MKEFLRKYWLHIGLVVAALGLVVGSLLLLVPGEKFKDLINYLFYDSEGKKITVKFMLSLAQLFIVIVFVKVLLAQRAFLDAIYKHFKTIFIEKPIIELYNQDELRQIATKLNSATKYVNVSFDELRQKSIEAQENDWGNGNKENSSILIESINIDTVYSSEQEINHKIFTYKMMNDEQFFHNYYFIPFDEDTNPDQYTINDKNRWEGKNFNYIATRLNKQNESLVINAIFSEDPDKDGKKWIKIHFEEDLNERSHKLVKGDEFRIEFSVSTPIRLGDTDVEKSRRKSYYTSVYENPCAVRKMKFQIETYSDKKLYFEPIISINKKPQKVKPVSTIYYDKWEWEFFYINNKTNKICISIED